MTEFATAPAGLPRVAPLDPTKHVRYSLGMVLGVDDFDQEFAYLSARDRRLARDLHGFGTAWGLRVGIAVGAEGPRLEVSPGLAVTPSGQLVCVTPAQCAQLNAWLDENEDAVRDFASPPESTELYLVLCYRECPTDDVPIPGEPCRSEDTLTEPSRLRDDFRLELRLEPPRQPEEDAVRDVVAWLRSIPVIDGPGSSVDELLGALREAASDAGELRGSPPGAEFDLLLGPPPASLSLGRHDAPEHLRAAFAVWVTELLPLTRTPVPGCACGCGCAAGEHGEPCDDDDVVLLARIELDLAETPDGELVVADDGWQLDETRRPYLLQTRFLQEWALWDIESAPLESPPPGPPAGPQLVAGGQVRRDGSIDFAFGGLTVWGPLSADLFALRFDGFDPDRRYVLTGAALLDASELGDAELDGPARRTFEIVDVWGTEEGQAWLYVRSGYGARSASGFHVLVHDITAVSEPRPALDRTPPEITVPEDRLVEATGPGGAIVGFTVSATDEDGPVPVDVSPASGSQFPLGETVVSCTATDTTGNTAHAQFTVTVRDTTPPAITRPPDMNVNAPAGANGALVPLPAVSAVDIVDGFVPVTCTPPSLSLFPIGTTLVNCVAHDAAGNVSTATFQVVVRKVDDQPPPDLTPPVITAPAQVIVEATSPAGAVVNFAVSAVDGRDGPIAVTCTPPPGSVFALGETTVRCEARDQSGNAATRDVKVIVRDTTPPVITATINPVVAGDPDRGGATVPFVPAPSAFDLVSGAVGVDCAPKSGSFFPFGATAVKCEAKDAAGNVANASFVVTVLRPVNPNPGIPNPGIPGGGGLIIVPNGPGPA